MNILSREQRDILDRARSGRLIAVEDLPLDTSLSSRSRTVRRLQARGMVLRLRVCRQRESADYLLVSSCEPNGTAAAAGRETPIRRDGRGTSAVVPGMCQMCGREPHCTAVFCCEN